VVQVRDAVLVHPCPLVSTVHGGQCDSGHLRRQWHCPDSTEDLLVAIVEGLLVLGLADGVFVEHRSPSKCFDSLADGGVEAGLVEPVELLLGEPGATIPRRGARERRVRHIRPEMRAKWRGRHWLRN
jgi:hypothetical protein